jgi:hypothetical protein
VESCFFVVLRYIARCEWEFILVLTCKSVIDVDGGSSVAFAAGWSSNVASIMTQVDLAQASQRSQQIILQVNPLIHIHLVHTCTKLYNQHQAILLLVTLPPSIDYLLSTSNFPTLNFRL